MDKFVLRTPEGVPIQLKPSSSRNTLVRLPAATYRTVNLLSTVTRLTMGQIIAQAVEYATEHMDTGTAGVMDVEVMMDAAD